MYGIISKSKPSRGQRPPTAMYIGTRRHFFEPRDDNDNVELNVDLSPRSKKYDQLVETMKNTDNNIDKIKVVCTGRFWRSSTTCGIKFFADSIKCARQYNFI